MAEVAKHVETYNGHSIYHSLRTHTEFVGSTLYRVDEGEYFAEARREPSLNRLPGVSLDTVITGKTIDEVKRGVDKFERG